MAKQKKKLYRILSLDGGGIRGIIPAMVLAHLEEVTRKKTYQLFDLIAGTSTGGILALALTSPRGGKVKQARYSARNVVDFYQNEGPRIFPEVSAGIAGTIHNIFEERYSSFGIDTALDSYFGITPLSAALVDVLVPSYDLESRTAYFFKRYKARSGEAEFLMRDVARATSAAPTYFEPHKVQHASAPIGHFSFIDGGVFANNPAACALVEAFDKQRVDPSQICMLSLGTGESIQRISHESAKRWGLAGWAPQILGTAFDGNSDTVHYQCERILNRPDSRHYFRLNPSLNSDEVKLDNSRRDNLERLKLRASDLIATCGHELQAVTELLLA